MDSTIRWKRSSQSNLIALDCDGVLLDYHEAYQRFWEITFGERPMVRNPKPTGLGIGSRCRHWTLRGARTFGPVAVKRFGQRCSPLMGPLRRVSN